MTKYYPVLKALSVALFATYLLAPTVYGQQTIHGVVTDQDEKPLPFVNILVNNDPHQGTTTDIDGRFQLPITDSLVVLTFKYVGFLTFTNTYQSDNWQEPLTVRLQSAGLNLEEIVVYAGENPAHRIIRSAVANRRLNNPEKLQAYQCERYNKMVFSFVPNEPVFQETYAKKDTSKKAVLKGYNKIARIIENSQNRHLFVMEALSSRYFQAPDQQTEKVMHNRVSGFQNPTFVAIANEIQPFSFYDEKLSFVGQDFLNPISPGSIDQYFFDLRDTLFQDQDTTFIITYHPRKEKTFNGLKGILYINSHRYAIQNVTAQPNDTSVLHLNIEQKYQRTDSGVWFPEQLNFEITLPAYPTPYLGMGIKGKSYINKVVINPSLDKSVFAGNELVTLEAQANEVTDSLWKEFRPESLNNLETATYEHMDSLGIAKKFDRKLRLFEGLAAGRLPLGNVDLDLNRLMSFNDFEGSRFGVGLITNKQFSKIITPSAYVGYGLRDESWKYGGMLDLLWQESSEFRLKIFYQKDLREPATANFPFVQNLVSQRFFADRMDRLESFGAEISGFPIKYLQLGLSGQRNLYRPIYDYSYTFGDEPARNTFDYTLLQLKLQYAFGRKYIRVLGNKIPTETPYPTLSISFTQGLDNDGLKNFHQLLFSVQQNVPITTLGSLKYRFEVGWTNQDVPYPFLFGTSGIGRDLQFFVLDNTFQTMSEYEFLSDRFLSLFLRYDLGRPLYRSKFSRPRISIAQHYGWGDLRNPEHHQSISFSTIDRHFLESGLIISELLRINYLNFQYIGLGLAVYYRYGAYHLPELQDNFAYRLNFNFSF